MLYWTTKTDTYLQHFINFFDQTNKNPKRFSDGECLGTCWSKKYFGQCSSKQAPLSSISLNNLRSIWFFFLCKFTLFSCMLAFLTIKIKSFAWFFPHIFKEKSFSLQSQIFTSSEIFSFLNLAYFVFSSCSGSLYKSMNCLHLPDPSYPPFLPFS